MRAERDQADLLAQLFRRVEAVPQLWVLAGCGAVTVLVAVLDATVAPLLSLSVFYLLPVLVVAARSVRTAVCLTLFTVTAWCAVDLLRHGDVYGSPAVPVANGLSRLLVLSIVVVLVSALRQDREREARAARRDPLTGLLNARSFHDAVEVARRAQQRTGRPVTVAYLDLDDFKAVNDSAGHAAGDLVLRRTGTLLSAAVRAGDVVARLGGDEFAVLMPQTPQAEAVRALTRVHQQLTQAGATTPERAGESPVPATADRPVQVSIGGVTFPEPLETAAAMISEADGVMYRAKHGGKNEVQVTVHGVRADLAEDAR